MLAMAPDAGRLGLAFGFIGGRVGLARPLPFTRPLYVTARDVQEGMKPGGRKVMNRGMITRVCSDAGYLVGFAFGTPLTATGQPVQT